MNTSSWLTRFPVGGIALGFASSVIAFLALKTLQLLIKGKLIPPAPPA